MKQATSCNKRKKANTTKRKKTIYRYVGNIIITHKKTIQKGKKKRKRISQK
jgi:hypothetical protein